MGPIVVIKLKVNCSYLNSKNVFFLLYIFAMIGLTNKPIDCLLRARLYRRSHKQRQSRHVMNAGSRWSLFLQQTDLVSRSSHVPPDTGASNREPHVKQQAQCPGLQEHRSTVQASRCSRRTRRRWRAPRRKTVSRRASASAARWSTYPMVTMAPCRVRRTRSQDTSRA